ncbi:anthranilate synthase component II, partial [Bacteroidota bacterium]
MKILVIDNYDSFTFNLVQLIGEFTKDIIVERNDAITSGYIEELKPEKIIISPGPGRPENSIFSLDVVKLFFNKVPILGVCLGHQCISSAFGGKIIKVQKPKHGKLTSISHDGKSIFKSIPYNFNVTLYHSLMVDKDSLPEELEVSAYSSEGLIMGIRHKKYPVEGVQFHPEAILTEHGETLI